MPALFAMIPPLFAADPQNNGLMSTLLPLAPIPILLYFLILRPQQQQERRRKEMLGALKKNDKVLTSAGIYGTVVAIDADGDKVVVRVDDDRGVKLAFSRASIVRIVDLASDKEKVAESA